MLESLLPEVLPGVRGERRVIQGCCRFLASACSGSKNTPMFRLPKETPHCPVCHCQSAIPTGLGSCCPHGQLVCFTFSPLSLGHSATGPRSWGGGWRAQIPVPPPPPPTHTWPTTQVKVLPPGPEQLPPQGCWQETGRD